MQLPPYLPGADGFGKFTRWRDVIAARLWWRFGSLLVEVVFLCLLVAGGIAAGCLGRGRQSVWGLFLLQLASYLMNLGIIASVLMFGRIVSEMIGCFLHELRDMYQRVRTHIV